MKCRHCATSLEHTFLDLGYAPPSNAYLTVEELSKPEIFYPLKVMVCDKCWLVQTEDYSEASELFSSDYAYFSSTSTGWLNHASIYAQKITQQLKLTKESFVIEVASNDGYLLKNFIAAGIPCLGIEPTKSTASVAEKLGIPVIREFFGEQLGLQLASSGKKADLIVANNVFAHVPDINDFTRGLKAALKNDGTITLEFPHLMRLIEHTQFDTVYHEHFSYLTLYTVDLIFKTVGLRIWNVEEFGTHGGSLRIYVCHSNNKKKTKADVNKILMEETRRGMQNLSLYSNFQIKANRVKFDLLALLIKLKLSGKKVVAYGAAAKGNTLLNYAGVKPDLISIVCDAAVAKQGKYMPGSHIPILPPVAIQEQRPDYVLILPWNIKPEIIEQLDYIREWGGRFLTAIPEVRII
jgi:SAM-dependent methyltransferase